MITFGQLLKKTRRQCTDPIRGGLLTQERLGELIGHVLGDAGYTGAAISEWERDKSRIPADNRLVLLSLVMVLQQNGGLQTPGEANALLHAGEYRGLDQSEALRVFPDQANHAPDTSTADRTTPLPDSRRPSAVATPAPDSDPQRNKKSILLQKVSHFWVEGVLQRSVQDAVLLDLNWQRLDDAVDHPWRDLQDHVVSHPISSPAPTSLHELFVEADRALLILGEPGSGKTITLLRLAQALIALAESDADRPVPVVLNLASWGENRGDLSEWIVEELTEKYQIPRQLGQEWLANDELILLLDGLDHVAERHQEACIQAINHFRQSQGLTGIVVCSRLHTYETLNARLKLGAAIAIAPLSRQHINAYVDAAKKQSEELQLELSGKQGLSEILSSPLVLSIMTPALLEELQRADAGATDWADSRSTSIAGDSPLQQVYPHLFGSYVNQMLQNGRNLAEYSSNETVSWLGWIAGQMHHHNQSTFLVEQIQPSWLPTRRWRRIYMFLSRLTDGAAFGLVMWLLTWQFRVLEPAFDIGLAATFSEFTGVPLGNSRPLAFLSLNLFLSFLSSLIYLLLFDVFKQQNSGLTRRNWRRVNTVVVGLWIGLVTFAIVYFWGDPGLALAWGTAEALLFGLFARYSYGSDYRDEIRTGIALTWSWSGAAKGIIIGLLVAVLAEFIQTQLYGSNGFWDTVVSFGLSASVLGGLTGQQLKEAVRPNHGIWFAVRNSLIAALLAGTVGGMVTGLVFRDTTSGILTGLFLALLALPLYGGSNVTRHYLLRFILWQLRLLPRKAWGFLHHVERSTLMYRVGGGYIFIHPLLQDYFRNLPRDRDPAE